jgi:hypothetical protein
MTDEPTEELAQEDPQEAAPLAPPPADDNRTVEQRRLDAFRAATKKWHLTDEEHHRPPDPEEESEEPAEEEQSADLEQSADGQVGLEEPEEGGGDDEAYRRAVAALLRSGFNQAEVETMDRERAIERGLARHEILARDDAAYSRLRELNKGGAEETPEKPTEPTEPEPVGVPSMDFKEAVTPFADINGLDEEQAEALGKMLEAVVGPLQQEIHTLKGDRSSDQVRAVEQLVMSAREEVGKSYPDLLSDEDVFARTVERMNLLQGDSAYAAIADPQARAAALMRDSAASLRLKGEQAPSTGRRTVRRPTPDTPTARKSTPVNPENMTQDEKRWLVFKHLQKHPGDVAGAQRAIGLGA